MILVTDFSENTTNKFNSVLSKEAPLVEFIDLLFNLDFEPSEIIEFVKSNFKGCVKFTKERLNTLKELNA